MRSLQSRGREKKAAAERIVGQNIGKHRALIFCDHCFYTRVYVITEIIV